MANELGADGALLSFQDHNLGEAKIVAAWGQWRGPEAVANRDRARTSGRFRRDGRAIADALMAPVRSPSGRTGALAVGSPASSTNAASSRSRRCSPTPRWSVCGWMTRERCSGSCAPPTEMR